METELNSPDEEFFICRLCKNKPVKAPSDLCLICRKKFKVRTITISGVRIVIKEPREKDEKKN